MIHARLFGDQIQPPATAFDYKNEVIVAMPHLPEKKKPVVMKNMTIPAETN